MPYILIFLLLLTTGCATMTNGSTQELSFQTTPEGVTVTLFAPAAPPPERPIDARADGWTPPQKKVAAPAPKLLGSTPLRITIDRLEGQTILFSKDGYKPLTMQLATRTNPAYWGNVVFGIIGLASSATDHDTGAAWEYVPNQYFVTLTALEATSIDRNTGQAQRDKAIVFIVRRYAAILADLSRGAGEDWTALLGVLQIGPGQDTDARDKIRAFATIYTDAAAFAMHVADFYLRK